MILNSLFGGRTTVPPLPPMSGGAPRTPNMGDTSVQQNNKLLFFGSPSVQPNKIQWGHPRIWGGKGGAFAPPKK